MSPSSLSGKSALVTGSSRGVGAAVAKLLAASGVKVLVNYRNKAARALRVVEEIELSGGRAFGLEADLTTPSGQESISRGVRQNLSSLDLLILNASGGMEAGTPADYALRLNRDAQLSTLATCLPFMPEGARVIFVTSHQAHFIRSHPTLKEYEPVAKSKRAGEDALRQKIAELKTKGIELVVVSADMIIGTVTATLLNRIYPGAIESRLREVGRLYTVEEFAAEILQAACQPVPVDNLRLVGDVGSFQ